MIDFSVGRWAVVASSFHGRSRPLLIQIEVSTAKLVKGRLFHGRPLQWSKAAVIATFAEQETAAALQAAILEITAEREAALQAAHEAWMQAVEAKVLEFSESVV